LEFDIQIKVVDVELDAIYTIRFTNAITNIFFINFERKILKFLLYSITNKILSFWGIKLVDLK